MKGFSRIEKKYTYDITPPMPPTFTSPTTGTDYTINNGVSSIMIKGKVAKDIVQLIGPGNSVIPLYLDVSGEFRNFFFPVPVAVGSDLTLTFTAFDSSSNSSSQTMSIHSHLGIIPTVAAVESGGSQVFIGNNMIIESTISHMSGSKKNGNTLLITGSTAISGGQ